jgi:hypothetical protein
MGCLAGCSHAFNPRDRHSGTDHTTAHNGSHVATASDNDVLESRVNDIENVTRLSWFFEADDDVTDFEQRACGEFLDVQSLHGEVLAQDSRFERKALFNELLQNFEIEQAQGSVEAVVFVVSVKVALNSLDAHFGVKSLPFRNAASRCANGNDSWNHLRTRFNHL